ncbi:hypothetical protein As57867_002450, partial [Aphanomyces stellatus]
VLSHALPVLVFNVGIPICIYLVAKQYTSEIVAVFLSGLMPTLKTLYSFFGEGKQDAISMLQVVGVLASVVTMFLTKDAKVLFLLNFAVGILMGVFTIFSLLWLKEDLWFQLRRTFTVKTDEEMDELYTKSHVRTASRFITFVSGLVSIFVGAISVVLVLLLSVDTFMYVSAVVPLAVLGPFGWWAMKYTNLHDQEPSIDVENHLLLKPSQSLL